MPRVVARYIDWEPMLIAVRGDFIPRAGAAIQCWKTRRNGHNSGTVPRQGAAIRATGTVGGFPFGTLLHGLDLNGLDLNGFDLPSSDDPRSGGSGGRTGSRTR